MNNKSCIVISTYFGRRRTSPSGVHQTIEYLDEYFNKLVALDSGVDSDIIIVNHACPDTPVDVDFNTLHHNRSSGLFETNNKDYDLDGESLKFLSKFNGMKTINGEVKVVNRGRESGVGRSFKSFDYAFNLFKNDYDYWFFVEDDVPIILPNYFKYSIKQLEDEQKNNVAFICGYSEVADEQGEKHCHGGAGCTHKKFLEKIVEKYGHLPFCKDSHLSVYQECTEPVYRCNEIQGEVMFTNIFIKEGYNISAFNTKKYSNGKKIIENITGGADGYRSEGEFQIKGDGIVLQVNDTIQWKDWYWNGELFKDDKGY